MNFGRKEEMTNLKGKIRKERSNKQNISWKIWRRKYEIESKKMMILHLKMKKLITRK
jgi:hypothetical protein